MLLLGWLVLWCWGELCARVMAYIFAAQSISARPASLPPETCFCKPTSRSLMATPIVGRQIAVVPYTEGTFRLATRLAPRCALAGINLALVKSRGEVIDIPAS